MAKKDSLGDTAELRAAIAELQARIDAREKRIAKAESDIVQESWIQKEDTYEEDEESDSMEETYAGEGYSDGTYSDGNYSNETEISDTDSSGVYSNGPVPYSAYPDETGSFGIESGEDSYEPDAYGEHGAVEEAEDALMEEDTISRRKKRIIRETTDTEYDTEETAVEPLTQEKRQEKQRPEKSSRSGKKRRRNDGDVIISLKNVSKSYVKDIPALSNVNIQIRRGEFVFIVGSSGSGKSTLIRLLLRELQPTSGSIMINGLQVDKLRRGKIPKLRRSMGVVFQDFRLLKDRNVYENVAFAQRIIQIPPREMKKNVPNMLATVGLAGKYKANPNELSGGEQQRVAIARALVNRPPILLADEPTGNLDPKNTMEIMHLLEQINENGTTVIVVTHDDKMVDEMKKRVITIRKGVVISDEEKGGYSNED